MCITSSYLIDYVMDNAAISTYNGSGIVDIKSFDKHYKALVKGPLRLLEVRKAVSENAKLYSSIDLIFYMTGDL